MIQVVGIGAGGHARVLIDTLQCMGGYEIIGLLDMNEELWNTDVMGIPVWGYLDMLPEFYQQGIQHAFIGLGSVRDPGPRKRLYLQVREAGFEIVQALHPHAYIAASVQLGRGAMVMAGAVINAESQIGENTIVNTGAIVEHNCTLGDHVHIATGALLAGTVHIGDGSHIGVGAAVRQGIHIGKDAIVGAGAVVVDDVPDHMVVVGVPARKFKTGGLAD